jgi:hypothetical protein
MGGAHIDFAPIRKTAWPAWTWPGANRACSSDSVSETTKSPSIKEKGPLIQGKGCEIFVLS